MRFATTRLALIALAFAGACHVTTSPDSKLDLARQQWALKHPSSYDIVVHRTCFCTTEMTTPVLVSVREGVVTSRTYTTTGAAVGLQYAQYFPNVEGLFLIVDDALVRSAAKLDVSYDAMFGYPGAISIDYSVRVADDELDVTVTGFVAK